jgi:hypothetical protein
VPRANDGCLMRNALVPASMGYPEGCCIACASARCDMYHVTFFLEETLRWSHRSPP